MNVHYLQHVPFEGLGSMESWWLERGARITGTRLFEHAVFPDLQRVDWLVILGGPMSVNDEAVWPWLKAEKRYAADAMEAGKRVLGICLGAQLIASVLGSRVSRNTEREIGWFPVRAAGGEVPAPWAGMLPRSGQAFHWHGETFDLPEGAVRLASSEACENQVFAVGDRVLGLQCHYEMTPEGAAALATEAASELQPGRFVQMPEQFLARPERFAAANRVMESCLGALQAVRA